MSATTTQNDSRMGKMKWFPLAALAICLLAAQIPAALAQSQVTHLRVSDAAYGGTQQVSLGANKSMIVDLPADALEVIVSQPTVAGAVMRSKRRAIVQGVAAGGTNIFFLDGAGRTILVLDLIVAETSTDTLTAALARTIPGSRIQAENFGDRVVLSGTVLSADDLQKAIAIGAQFAGDPTQIASVITVTGNQQVMLKVTVAEVQRDTAKQFGIDISAGFTSGGLTTGIISAPTAVPGLGISNPNEVNVGFNLGGLTIDATLRALEQRNAIRTLAEPTLTALSGQPAEFIAGGEFPYNTIVDGDLVTAFKEFGVQLAFTPTVRSNGVIGLLVDVAVSEPTGGGATSRRGAKTTVELPAGCTLAIGGIIQDSMRQQISQFPGLGNIPILGTLFRSRDFVRSQTELLILVTPYLADTSTPIALPTDGYIIPTDAEAIFLGQMEKMYAVGEPDGMRGSYSGSVGFVLD